MKPTTSLALLATASQIEAHAVISYPPWRGNNLISNATFPFGMARSYPCGGVPPTTNRTSYPLDGTGAFAIEPGWSAGHGVNFVYINLCLGGPDEALGEVRNCSLVITGPLELRGPTDEQYAGTVCLPRLGLPKGVVVKKGDLASIQVVQNVKHGAALYSCADIIFTDDKAEVPAVNETNCFNSTGLSLKDGKFVPNGEASAAGSGAAGVAAHHLGVFSATAGLLTLLYLL